MPNGAGSHKDDLLVAVLSFWGSSKAEHVFRSNFVQYHFKARCGYVVTFINYHMPIVLNNGRNGIVFLVNQALIRRYVNDSSRLILSAADDADLRFWQKRAQSFLSLIKQLATVYKNERVCIALGDHSDSRYGFSKRCRRMQYSCVMFAHYFYGGVLIFPQA